MTASLHASIEPLGQTTLGRPLRMRIWLINSADHAVRVVSPALGEPPPELGWTASGETYRLALLLSLGRMRLSMRDSDGVNVVGKQPMPWVDPLVGSRLLAPGEAITLEFDLNAFFTVAQPGRYEVEIEYIDATTPARATVEIDIGPTCIAPQEPTS